METMKRCNYHSQATGVDFEIAQVDDAAALIRRGEEEGKRIDIRFLQCLDPFFAYCDVPLSEGIEAGEAILIETEQTTRIIVKTQENERLFADLARLLQKVYDQTLPQKEFRFPSFDGGGYRYEVETLDPGIYTWFSIRKYHCADHERLCGAGYDVVITIFPLREGKGTSVIHARSPIIPAKDYRLDCEVDADLNLIADTDPKVAC